VLGCQFVFRALVSGPSDCVDQLALRNCSDSPSPSHDVIQIPPTKFPCLPRPGSPWRSPRRAPRLWIRLTGALAPPRPLLPGPMALRPRELVGGHLAIHLPCGGDRGGGYTVGVRWSRGLCHRASGRRFCGDQDAFLEGLCFQGRRAASQHAGAAEFGLPVTCSHRILPHRPPRASGYRDPPVLIWLFRFRHRRRLCSVLWEVTPAGNQLAAVWSDHPNPFRFVWELFREWPDDFSFPDKTAGIGRVWAGLKSTSGVTECDFLLDGNQSRCTGFRVDSTTIPAG
jgi:hypothetical protein